jgi:hypothetical protein
MRFFYYWWGGTESPGIYSSPYVTKSLVLRPLWRIVQTLVIDEDDFWSNWWNENWQGKPKYSEKTYPSAALSTTKSHTTRPGLEPRTAAVGNQRLTA